MQSCHVRRSGFQKWLVYHLLGAFTGTKSHHRERHPICLTAVSGRREYLALFGSLILIALESLIRIVTLGLRESVFEPTFAASLTLFSVPDHKILLREIQNIVPVALRRPDISPSFTKVTDCR